jgi:hypothetical protein
MRPTTAVAGELATVVSDLDRGRVVEAIDGRSRRRVATCAGWRGGISW